MDEIEIKADDMIAQFQEVVRMFEGQDDEESREIVASTKRMLVRMELKK